MKRVLVVEDDPMVAMINIEYLSKIKGYEVVGNPVNFFETLEYLKKEKIDLILLDVFLMGENGLDILKEIRVRGYNVDVIMITSANDSEDIKKAFSLGSVDYLIKPFDFDRFKEAITKISNRNKIFNDKKITQKELDKIYILDEKNLKLELPKGLNEKTFENLILLLEKEFKDVFGIKEACDLMGVSNVTIKKYLDYLEEIDIIEGSITYGNVGRPQYIYKKIHN